MKIFGNEKRHVYLTIVLGAIAVLANCFISLFITPRITNTIGIESYGYVTLAKNFVSYATILTTALNSYAARYMSIAYMRGEKNKFKEYFSTVFFGDLIIGLTLFIIGIIFIAVIDKVIAIEAHMVSEVQLLFLMCFIAFFVNTISTVFMATGYVKDRMEIINIIKTVSYIVEIIVLAFCFWVLEPSMWHVGLSSLCMALVVFSGSYILTQKTLPERTISKNYFSDHSLKELVGNGFWNSANSLGNTLNSGLDLLISNVMLTSIAMGQVSVARTINNIIFALYVAISQAFQPKLLKAFSENNVKRLIDELKRSMKISGIVTNCILAGFAVAGKEFLSLWIPGQDIARIFFITVIAMLPSVTEGCVYPLYYVYTLTVKNKIPCIVTIAGGLINVASMYILIKYTDLGVFAIVITTAVIMNVIVGIFNPIYISHCLKIGYGTFFPDLCFHVVLLVTTTLSMYCVEIVFKSHASSWIELLVKILVLAIIGFGIQILLVYIVGIVKTRGKECNGEK